MLIGPFSCETMNIIFSLLSSFQHSSTGIVSTATLRKRVRDGTGCAIMVPPERENTATVK